MQTLRHFTFLSRLVLAWFVLSLGVAVASPLVHPQDTLLVCTGAGAMKVLVTADDGSTRELPPRPWIAPCVCPPLHRRRWRRWRWCRSVPLPLHCKAFPARTLRRARQRRCRHAARRSTPKLLIL